MLAYTLLLLVPLLPLGGVFVARAIIQNDLDKRKTYRVYFPTDVEPEAVAGWLRTLSGTLRPESAVLRLMQVCPSIVLETISIEGLFVHRLKIPHQYESRIRPPLEHLVPGISLVPEDNKLQFKWKYAVEMGMRGAHRPLNIPDLYHKSHDLLARFQHLATGEALIMQWVISPAMPERKPVHGESQSLEGGAWSYLTGAPAGHDEINARRDKLDDNNLNAIVRIGAQAGTKARARHMVMDVKSSIKATAGSQQHFYDRMVGWEELQRRIDRATNPAMRHIRLTVTEMTALMGWRLGDVDIAGMPAPLARRLAAPRSVLDAGRVIGVSNFSGRERNIAIGHMETRYHTYVIGPTGFGKTTELYNMMFQDIRDGHGIFMLESKGGHEGLYQMALNAIPPERINDVILLDLTDFYHPIGLNVLDQLHVSIDELVGVLKGPHGSGPWIDMVLPGGIRTAQAAGLTIMDVPHLLMPTSDEVTWRDAIVRSLKSEDLRAFWQRIDKEGKYGGEKVSQSAWDRLQLLANRPEIGHILGQAKSSFNMDDVVSGKKILLANLSGVPKQSASMMGTLLFNLMTQSLRRVPPEANRSMMVYLDEFQHFMDMSVDMPEMLSEVRSRGASLTMAHQYLGQLDKPVEEAVMANAGTKIAFQLNASDARIMAANIGKPLTPEDLQRQGRFEAIASVYTPHGKSGPLTMNTLAPTQGYGLGIHVVEASRAKYGRPIEQVQEAMKQRRIADVVPIRKRPIRKLEDFGEANNQ